MKHVVIFQQEAFTHLSLCVCNCKATGAFFLPWASCWKAASTVPLVECYCAAAASAQTAAHRWTRTRAHVAGREPRRDASV